MKVYSLSISIIVTAILLGFSPKTNPDANPMASIVQTQGTVTLTQAAITAQDYVKQHFFYKCKFDDRDIRGEETSVRNRFNVLQKFTCKKDGVERQYVYKCILQYKGGDWTEISNWDFSVLIVEDVNTGRQWRYTGKL